jgi:hydrogenase/urease accessory protein HupE
MNERGIIPIVVALGIMLAIGFGVLVGKTATEKGVIGCGQGSAQGSGCGQK